MRFSSGIEPDTEHAGTMEIVKQILDKGLSLAASKGISEDELEAIYSISYNFYQQRKFKEAEKVFTFLCLYSHLDSRFWIGLGASREALGDFRNAIDAYSYSALLEHDNPIPPLQAAKCYLAMNNVHQAEKGLTAAIHWSRGKKKHKTVLATAQSLLDNLYQKHQELVS